MKVIAARFRGLAPAVAAIAAGVALGRVIESVAVGAVLFAVWTYVGRLVVPPVDDPAAARES